MRSTVVAVTLAVAASTAAAQEPLPRLWLSSRAPHHGDRLVVRGTGCPWSGLGNAYGVWLYNDARKNPDDYPPAGEDGRWEAAFLLRDIPAGRYRMAATCFKGAHPNDPAYPDESVTILPDAAPRVDGPLTVSDTTVRPGQAITVSGSGFIEAQSDAFRVSVFWGSAFLGSFKADRAVRGVVTVPREAAPGRYRLLMEGTAYPLKEQPLWTLVTYVTIAAPSPSPARTSAPAPEPTPAPTTPTPTPTPAAASTAPPSPSATTSPPATSEPPLVALAAEDDGGWPAGGVAGLALGSGAACLGALALVRRRRAAR